MSLTQSILEQGKFRHLKKKKKIFLDIDWKYLKFTLIWARALYAAL